MLVKEINGFKIAFIGDPHIGRKFETGVPLDRRGEREEDQRQQLMDQLMTPDIDISICLGDIFDKYAVPNELVLFVFNAYRMATTKNPNTTFFILRGNHDASRDADKASAFDVLAELLATEDNIYTVTEAYGQQFEGHDAMVRVGFMPWDPFINSKQQAQKLNDFQYGIYDVMVGHWDRVTFDENPHNCIPELELRGMLAKDGLVVSGHDHRPYDDTIKGMHVIFPGSMQPYSHGEDPDSEKYVTLTLDELKAALLKDPAQYHDMAVRVALKPGEHLDFQFDAWAVTTKPIAASGEELVDISVHQESFDMVDILTRCFDKNQVSKAVQDEALGIYHDRKTTA